MVDLLRVYGTITDITDNEDDTYTVEVDSLNTGEVHSVFDIANGDWITIASTTGFNDEWLISGLDDENLTFDISNPDYETGISIPGSFGTWKANKPYFAFEKWPKEANVLEQLNKIANKQFQKFPLIFLLEDISTSEGNKGYYSQANFNLFFIKDTEKNQPASWRLTNIFKVYLQPMYEWFNKKLVESNYTTAWRDRDLQRTKTNRYFLGTAGASQNELNTVVDAIEANYQNVQFKNEKTYCED